MIDFINGKLFKTYMIICEYCTPLQMFRTNKTYRTRLLLNVIIICLLNKCRIHVDYIIV